MLECRGVNVHYGRIHAVQDVSLEIGAGDIASIVGANGAGKTVFINMITGYENPTTGNIVFDGRDITRLPPREITRLGICRSFQISQIFSSMTVFENILFAYAIGRPSGTFLKPIHRADNAEGIAELLERFQLSAFRDRVVQELSQGVRKLLDIAMTIVGRPRVVMLDEPTSGISTEEKFEFMNVVMDALLKSKVTIFIVEHDMDIIEKYATRVLAFSQGRIICDATTRAALQDPDVIRYVLGNGDADD